VKAQSGPTGTKDEDPDISWWQKIWQ
jgi:hypothetical protein